MEFRDEFIFDQPAHNPFDKADINRISSKFKLFGLCTFKSHR